MKRYDFEYIDKLRIHELRDYARMLGVSSPTTMRKEELIAKISDIIHGYEGNSEVNSKYVKNIGEIDFFELLTSENTTLLDSLLADKESSNNDSEEDSGEQASSIIMKKTQGYDKHSVYPTTQPMYSFSFKLSQNECQYSDTDIFDVEGYIDIHPSGYGIVRGMDFMQTDQDPCLTKTLLKKNKLKKGQYVRAKAKYIMDNYPMVVFEIRQIEEDYKAKLINTFDEVQHAGLGEEYYLEKFDYELKRGDRHYIKSMSLKDAVDFGFDIVDENGVDVKLINIKAKPEEQYLSHQKMQVINIPFNKTASEVIEIVELVLERVKREFEIGKSNVILLYNFSELMRLYNVASEGCLEFTKFNANALNKIAQILYMTRCLEKNLNCTVVCIDKNGMANDVKSILELEFLPLYNIVKENIDRK